MNKLDVVIPIILSISIVGSLLMALVSLAEIGANDKHATLTSSDTTNHLKQDVEGVELDYYSTSPLFKGNTDRSNASNQPSQSISRKNVEANYNMLSYIASQNKTRVFQQEEISSDNYNATRRTAKKERTYQKDLCKYWANKHSKDGSSYNHRMMLESCRNANTRIVYRNQPSQNIVINNNVNQFKGSQQSQNSSSCHSLNRCSHYKNNLALIQKRMRNGYLPHEYNRLESRRKYWKKQLTTYCACHRTNSF